MFRNAILAAVFAYLVYGTVKYLMFMDVFKVSFKHYPGTCKKVKGARYGSEDMAWTREGLVFVTTGLSTPAVEKHLLATGTHGEIQLFDFQNPTSGVVNLKIEHSKDLNLTKTRFHGITLQEDKTKGEHILYVLNHPSGEDSELIEKFKFSPSTRQLSHLKTIELDNSFFFNNIVALSEDQFFITNFAYMPSKSVFFHALVNLFHVSLGSLHFYNGTSSTAVTPRLLTPNGVALSPDQRHVYVAATMEQSVYVYYRDSSTNTLSLVQKVYLGIKGDNLNLTPEGDALLLGAIPVFYKMVIHLMWALSPDCISPSSVLRIPLGADGLVQESDITELFYDPGDLISGSSTAATYKDQLLIGSVANSLVHCQSS
ncbi:serum paraoxonase/arylesterase 2 [Elysia marginata]|uniref:Paraoxonase n=1 Tax=Elysia marginata TaxID=1093978 RepID=A0AAV4IGC0_9GAST|nr:serum paraoxonase/arylesterase 2 [Elysia marginata]